MGDFGLSSAKRPGGPAKRKRLVSTVEKVLHNNKKKRPQCGFCKSLVDHVLGPKCPLLTSYKARLIKPDEVKNLWGKWLGSEKLHLVEMPTKILLEKQEEGLIVDDAEIPRECFFHRRAVFLLKCSHPTTEIEVFEIF